MSERIMAEWSQYAPVNLPVIGSNIVLSPDWIQAILCAGAGILLIESFGIIISDIWITIRPFHPRI